MFLPENNRVRSKKRIDSRGNGENIIFQKVDLVDDLEFLYIVRSKFNLFLFSFTSC